MDKEKIEEYAELKGELSTTTKLIIPFAFMVAGVLMFVSYLLNTIEFSWFSTILGFIGLIIFIGELKSRKKKKIRFKELRKELGLEE